MKKAVTILSICLLAIAGTKTIHAQTDEKMSEKEIEVRMNAITDMAYRNRILNSREKKIAFSKDYKNTIYEVKGLEYKYVYFVGDKIVPLPFDEMKPLLPFRIYVKYKIKGKWGAFEVGGKELLKPEYDEIKYDNPQKDNYYYYYVRESGKDYYIDIKNGDRKPYLILDEKNKDYPKRAFKNGLYGLVNAEKKLTVSLKYDEMGRFKNGLAAVALDKKYGFINTKGETVIPLKYDYAEDFSEGLAIVGINHKYGFINTKDKIIIPLKYDNAFMGFSEGVSIVCLNGKYGVIDQAGNTVLSPKYDGAYSFREGLAAVTLNGKYGFIDKSGKEVIPVKYDYANRFYEGKAEVKLNGKTFYIDKNGNEIKE